MVDSIHGDTGKLLFLGTSVAAALNGESNDGDMAANFVSELVKMPTHPCDITIEPLYTGSPTGTWAVYAANAGPLVDLGLLGITNPDGTSYAGSLTAADLRLADLGSTLINVSGFAGGVIQLRYTASSGTGTANARIRIVA